MDELIESSDETWRENYVPFIEDEALCNLSASGTMAPEIGLMQFELRLLIGSTDSPPSKDRAVPLLWLHNIVACRCCCAS